MHAGPTCRTCDLPPSRTPLEQHIHSVLSFECSRAHVRRIFYPLKPTDPSCPLPTRASLKAMAVAVAATAAAATVAAAAAAVATVVAATVEDTTTRATEQGLLRG